MSDGAPGPARWLMAAVLLVPSLCALGATLARADEPLLSSWMKRWITEPPAAENWFGVRDVLNVWGIKPSVSYGTDLMASVAGGQRRGQAYAGQLAVDVSADLGKLAGLTGLTFDVGADWGSGTDLSRDIGNTFTVAQYFEGQEVRLSNMYLQQSLFTGRVDLKAGRFSTGADFLSSPTDASFVNEALNPILLAVQQNVPGVTANAEKGASGMPGRYRMGAYHDSNQYTYLDNPGRQQTGNYGVFMLGEQMVFREGGPGSDTGLALFGAVIYAPQSSINPMPWFASAGASYQGLIPGRDRDTAAFALYYGGFSRDLPGQTYELVLAWTYAIAVGGRITVQPDVQYVINPGGVSSVGNAVVLGVQLAIGF